MSIQSTVLVLSLQKRIEALEAKVQALQDEKTEKALAETADVGTWAKHNIAPVYRKEHGKR